jgi:hypothetical protein
MPVTPVVIGKPVALVKTAADGVPSAGVTSVGLVANTSEPVPVSSVTADARLAELGVARKVATLVPRPDTPVLIGKPVALVKVPLEGVPSAGVTSVGLVDRTTFPVPVLVVTPVPPLATGKVPVTPVVIGKPVALVKVTLEGVPSAGVTSVGLVANTLAPVPVSSVNAAARFALDGVARKVATPVPRPDTPVLIGRPVALVNVPLVGVPKIGVTNVGLVDKTTFPVPVEVVTPVPPLATGKVPVRLVITVEETFTKSEPFQAQTAFSFRTMVTPVVGPTPRSTMLWVLELLLMTMYALD